MATLAEPHGNPCDHTAALAAVMARMEALSEQMAMLTLALEDRAADEFAVTTAFSAGRRSEREQILGTRPSPRKRPARTAPHLRTVTA